MYRSRLFNWKDIRRIAKSTFNDSPLTVEEIRAWTETIFFLSTSVKTVIRQMSDVLEFDPVIRKAVIQTIRDSTVELQSALKLFPGAVWEDFLYWFYENVLTANVGFVKILGEKEIEKDADTTIDDTEARGSVPE